MTNESLRLAAFGLMVACSLAGAACKHADQTQATNACDTARVAKLEQQGYAWLAKNQWYNAHLVGHALIAISGSCSQAEIAIPAGIKGTYLLAAVSHAVHDERQSAYWLQSGLQLLSLAKQHEAESPALIAVYDQMQPRFLTLQSELRVR